MSSFVHDPQLLQRELDLSNRELKWLLAVHFPALLAELAIHLQEALNELSALDTMMGASAAFLPIVAPNDTVRGSATIAGTAITKAELIIKSPNINRGHQLKTSLSAPLNLEQLQQASNHLGMALESLQNYFPPYTQQTIVEIIQKINLHLNMTSVCVGAPDRSRLFPRMMLPTKLLFANTPLPDDAYIHFHIARSDTLVMSIYTMHVHSHTGGSPSPSPAFGQSTSASSSGTSGSGAMAPGLGTSPSSGSNVVNQLGGMVKEQLLQVKKQHRKRLTKDGGQPPFWGSTVGVPGVASASVSGSSLSSMTSANDRYSPRFQLPDGRWVEITSELAVEVPVPLLQRFAWSLQSAEQTLDEISVKLQGF
ncbi:hypothetical protein RI367_008307 [Sorochytrium milnesiophthora]